MLHLNKKATVSFAYIGSVLSLAALLIFIILPDSELANGIQYSGSDALWVLALSPVFSLLGVVVFIYAFLKDYKVWQKLLSKNLTLIAIVVICALVLFCFAVYLSYFLNQLRLGFVAPYTNTTYDTLKIFTIAITAFEFIISTVAAVKIKK